MSPFQGLVLTALKSQLSEDLLIDVAYLDFKEERLQVVVRTIPPSISDRNLLRSAVTNFLMEELRILL